MTRRCTQATAARRRNRRERRSSGIDELRVTAAGKEAVARWRVPL
jgi:hypothetical protein